MPQQIYWHTTFGEAVAHNDCWNKNAVHSGICIDQAIDDCISYLTGKHMHLFELVSVSIAFLTLDETVFPAVTITAKPIRRVGTKDASGS